MKDKMTEDQVKKALEICSTFGASCEDCPCFVSHKFSNCRQALKCVLEIINRKDAEIERYKGVIKILEKDVAEAKYKAFETFIETLKKVTKEMAGKS